MAAFGDGVYVTGKIVKTWYIQLFVLNKYVCFCAKHTETGSFEREAIILDKFWLQPFEPTYHKVNT